MEKHSGLLTHTKLFKDEPYIIVGMLIWEDDTCINCIIKNRSFSKYVFSLPLHKYIIEVEGNYNQRNQFEVRHMKILNCDGYIAIIGTPE